MSKIDLIDALLLANGTNSSNVAPVSIQFLVGCSGNFYYGGFGTWAQSSTSTYNQNASEISSVAAGQNWYVVDGTNMLLVSGSSGATTSITTGSATQPPTGARLVSLYRNRLITGRTVTDPQNLFFSQSGNYTNNDYTDATVIGAFALNIPASAGEVGDIVTCVIPYSDDYLIIGLTASVYIMHGDPRAGGNVDALIRGDGIVGPQAYAHDPEGRLYYLSRRDLMVISGGAPQSISQGRIQAFLAGIDFSTYVLRMAWDIVNKGLWIFFTPATQPATGPIHMYWDARMDAFTLAQFPARYGPTAMKSLVGETYLERQLILGTFDGFLWTMSNNWITDGGTAVNSYVQLNPLAMAEEGERAILTETELVIGDIQQLGMTVEWYAGDNPQAAIEGAIAATSPTVSVRLTQAGRNLIRSRQRCQTGSLRISNSELSKRWAIESAICRVQPAGRTR